MRSNKAADREQGRGVSTSLLQIGRIVNRHGVRGELRVLLHNPASAVLEQRPSVVLRGVDGDQHREITAVRPHKHFVLVRFAGVQTANEAETLIGREVWVSRDLLPPAGPNEAYYVELVGCRVRTEDGRDLGEVREVFATGSNDVCAVECEGRELLIPLITDVIVRLDVREREIVVRPIAGLLDPQA